MVHDLKRPDVNGVPPKMQDVRNSASLVLGAVVPWLKITTDDNLMSSVVIRGSYEPKEQWSNGYFENSKLFVFTIKPMKGKRYYDPEDDKVEVELIQTTTGRKFRKYTGPVGKVFSKVMEWIEEGK